MRRIFPVPRSEGAGVSLETRDSAAAFTLVEVLIALAIVTAVVSTLLSVHLSTGRAEDKARDVCRGGLAAEHFAGLIWLGNDPRLAAEAIAGEGWRVTCDVAGGGLEGAAWMECSMAPSNRPWSQTVVYLQPSSLRKGTESP